MPQFIVEEGDALQVDFLDRGFKGATTPAILKIDDKTAAVTLSGKAALSGNAIVQFVAAGLAAPGAITATGAKVGDKVAGAGQAFNITTPAITAAGVFEPTVTVKDQIQQVSATNLSASTFLFTLIHQTPANS